MPALCILCNCVLSFFLSVLCSLRLPVIIKVLSYLVLSYLSDTERDFRHLHRKMNNIRIQGQVIWSIKNVENYWASGVGEHLQTSPNL